MQSSATQTVQSMRSINEGGVMSSSIQVAALRSGWATYALCGAMLMGCGTENGEPDPRPEVGVTVAALDIGVGSLNSAWSGKQQSLHASLSRPASSNDYVHGFSIGERSDDPCYFAALYNDIDNPANLDGNEVWDECDGGAGNLLAANMPNDYRTTGVAVCLNG